jgi:MYXO-CTERM domain-containing protein
VLALAAALALVTVAGLAGADVAGEPGSGGAWEERPPTERQVVPPGDPCPDEHPEWREATTEFGVEVEASDQCDPDNPKLVAASVVGTDEVPGEELDELALHEDAVTKCCDRDGDGDPDVINITLEVKELNGWELPTDVLSGDGFELAPGVAPAAWSFTPKTSVDHAGDAFFDIARLPSVVMRAEVDDEINVRLENTHYFPHTIHLHGSDHPFLDGDGEGNDGVPHISEKPVMPGEARTYTFTPREPGTQFYHCHVQPQVHVPMGLSTIFHIEPDRANNTLQSFNLGGGEVRAPSQHSQEAYDREYDLVYHDMDKELSAIVNGTNDPRVIAERQNRIHDATERDMDYFTLNGRSFPYTLRESQVVVAPNEEVRLNVINAGESTLSLHTHGHKMNVLSHDGVERPATDQRDTITLTAAQRAGVVLNTTNNGLDSYGPGVWFMHNHVEEAVTTDGIGPGGDITTITYESYLNETTRMPETAMDLDVFFTEKYYDGEIPVWQGLGGDHFLGQVARETTTETEEQAPAPGALAALGALAGLALLARREVRG